MQLRGCVVAALLVLGPILPKHARAYNIYVKAPDGSVSIAATAVWKIARKGLTFGKATEILNVNSLNTYPDYPELGFDTPENRATAEATATQINSLVHSAHEQGKKALLWSYEIENPPVLIAKHPELACGKGTGWYEYRQGDPRYEVNGLCLYKKGAREFIQKRFDEIFRRCPDVDGILFSLHESATRPIFGHCNACKGKSVADKIADTANLLDDCIRKAMQKVRPGKIPANYAREHGLAYAYAMGDAAKTAQVVEGLARIKRETPVIIRAGLGDYFEFMLTSPLLRRDPWEFPGIDTKGLAERNNHPFILDGLAGTRHLDNPACLPVYNGTATQRDFQAAHCSSLVGWGYARTRTTGETTAFRLNALDIDTAAALLVNPGLDVHRFAEAWYSRELDVTPDAARILTRIVIRAYVIDVLSTSVNGVNFPLVADGGVRGDPARWNRGWWERPGHHFGSRIAVIRPETDQMSAVYGFGENRYGFGPEGRKVKMTPEEKLAYILKEKAEAVALALGSLREAKKLPPETPAKLRREVLDQCELAVWFARAREAQARAFWTWWFFPETPSSSLRRLYRQYETVLAQPIPDGYTMSAGEIKDDERQNPYWGKDLFERTAPGFPLPENSR